MILDAKGLIRWLFPKPPKRLLSSSVCSSIGAVDYIANCVQDAALTTLTTTKDIIRAVPFWSPPRGGSIGRIACEITTLVAASNIRIGIYKNVASYRSHYPGALVEDSGNISSATTGLKTYTNTVALVPNTLYWMAFNCSHSTTAVRALNPNNVSSFLGMAAAITGSANPWNLYITVASAFGAFPDPFPAGGAYVTGAVNTPVLRYQFAA